LEALEKIKAGAKFNEIAALYSEDKARSGVRILSLSFFVSHSTKNIILNLRVTWDG
jgi:hypothetical protein